LSVRGDELVEARIFRNTRSAVRGLGPAAGDAAGWYVVASAGTKLLPERVRLTRYMLWMPTVLPLWWPVLLLGFAT